MNPTPPSSAGAAAPCLICGATGRQSFYRGPIRTGSFGKSSAKEAEITRCPGCGAQYLPPVMEDMAAYYQSGNYRQDLDQGNTVEKYFQLSDDEQTFKADILGFHQLRNRVVADVGCGGGSFLDLAKGAASRTIAIEPDQNYHASLAQRGHEVFPYASAALAQYPGGVEVAVSFSVIEHIERPREFLSEIRALLKPGGKLLLSTPNARDFLLEICPEYRAFFYRKVHLWYFDEEALRHLAKLAGFDRCEIHFKHRFDLSNFFIWLRDHRPSGLGAIPLDKTLNALWAQSLEKAGRSDYLYALLS